MHQYIFEHFAMPVRGGPIVLCQLLAYVNHVRMHRVFSCGMMHHQ